MNKYRLLFSLVAIGLLLTGCGKEEEDNTAPVLSSVIAPDLIAAGETVTLKFDAVDDDDDDLTLVIDGVEGAAYTAPTGADGAKTLSCTVTDGKDESEAVSVTVVVATVPAPASHWSFNADGADSYGFEDLLYSGSTTIVTGGIVGKAISFDPATQDDITGAAHGPVPKEVAFAAADAYTMSIWFNTATDSIGFLWGITNGDGWFTTGGEPGSLDPAIGSGKCLYLYFGGLYFDNTWNCGFQGGWDVDLSNGAWHNAVVVHDGTADTYALYVDGIPALDDEGNPITAGTTGCGAPGPTNPDPPEFSFTVGAAIETDVYNEYPGSLDGMIDSGAYWDSALTAAQVAALYAAYP